MNVLEIEFHGGVLHLNGRPAAEWVAEVYRLREENFRLAAGQCTSANADEGGRPYCAEARATFQPPRQLLQENR